MIKLVLSERRGTRMLSSHKMQKDPDMLEEYDFSQGIRGKYAKRYAEGTKI